MLAFQIGHIDENYTERCSSRATEALKGGSEQGVDETAERRLDVEQVVKGRRNVLLDLQVVQEVSWCSSSREGLGKGAHLGQDETADIVDGQILRLELQTLHNERVGVAIVDAERDGVLSVGLDQGGDSLGELFERKSALASLDGEGREPTHGERSSTSVPLAVGAGRELFGHLDVRAALSLDAREDLDGRSRGGSGGAVGQGGGEHEPEQVLRAVEQQLRDLCGWHSRVSSSVIRARQRRENQD